jgi:hypothetical protein
MAGLDQTLSTDKHIFVKDYLERAKENGTLADDPKIDENENFILAEFDDDNGKIDSGYVVIYVMTQTDENTSVEDPTSLDRDYYHNKHYLLYKAYYDALSRCRNQNWKKVFSVYGTAKNGTATKYALNAPNVKDTCDEIDLNKTKYPYYGHFSAPDNNILFGEVEISKYDDGDPRSLLLKARAIDNYTTENQMMMWAPGEYAAIQDRRIVPDGNGDGLADYDTNGIANDAKDMIKRKAYFAFNAQKAPLDKSTLIITQPMKRALGMAGHAEDYWQRVNIDANEWGQFSLGMQFYDEDENADVGEVQLVTITSPANSKDEELYKPEMAPLPYEVLARGANQKIFINNEVDGYADVFINSPYGLPAIVTEMVSRDINGEAQINWIYSATE